MIRILAFISNIIDGYIQVVSEYEDTIYLTNKSYSGLVII